MIDPVVSLQPATHRQYFMLALSLPLRWLRVTVVLNTMIAKSFGYVTGLINNSFNAIMVFKTTVTRSQRNGKDNANMKYCRWVAG